MKKLCVFILSIVAFINVNAAIPVSYRTDVDAFINQMVKSDGFKREDLTKLFDQVTIQPKIISAIMRPYEAKPWHMYRPVFVNDKRALQGAEFWQNHTKTLAKAEKRFGVPAEMIVAILGVETYYGKRQGSYRVLDALTTLAFNYPRRARFFTKELKQFLLLSRENKLDPLSLYGSYAGAIGQPQFMPSSYRAYAVDATGKGGADLRNNTADVIYSVANYFKKHGWQYKAPVTSEAKIKGKQFERFNTGKRKAEFKLADFKRAGIQPTLKAKLPSQVGLVELTAKEKPEYHVAFPNFYVITRYNTSKHYAMAVYELAEKIKTLKNNPKQLAALKKRLAPRSKRA